MAHSVGRTIWFRPQTLFHKQIRKFVKRALPLTLTLNLEQGRSVTGWGRMIFYVGDIDAFWAYLREKGFHPESPQDASWG